MEVKDIELQACPHCGGDGVIEDEGRLVRLRDVLRLRRTHGTGRLPQPRRAAGRRKARRVCLEHRQGRFQSPRRIKNRKSCPSEFSGGQLFVWVSPAQSRA